MFFSGEGDIYSQVRAGGREKRVLCGQYSAVLTVTVTNWLFSSRKKTINSNICVVVVVLINKSV